METRHFVTTCLSKERVDALGIKNIIHQVTAMLATSENVPFFYLHNTHQSHTHNHTSLITYTVITKKWAHVQRNTGTKTDVQVH